MWEYKFSRQSRVIVLFLHIPGLLVHDHHFREDQLARLGAMGLGIFEEQTSLTRPIHNVKTAKWKEHDSKLKSVEGDLAIYKH